MQLAQMNAQSEIKERHGDECTITLLQATDTLNACWSGVYSTTEYIAQLRRTAQQLNTLADAIEKTDK